MGVAALVLGIIGLVFTFVPFFPFTQIMGVILGLVALVLGLLGRKQGQDQAQPTGQATAGLVLGAVAVILSLAIFGTCMVCVKHTGGIVHEEFKKQLGSPEFQKALKEAQEKLNEDEQAPPAEPAQ